MEARTVYRVRVIPESFHSQGRSFTMKSRIITIFVLVLIACAVSTVSAVEVEKVDIELVDGYSVSYKIAVPDKLKNFLAANGVSPDLMESFERNAPNAKELSRAIDALKKTEPDDEDDVTLNCCFNTIVNGALFSAYSSGYDPVYMDIGTLRYVWTTPADDDDDD